jgi:hypothetical protein
VKSAARAVAALAVVLAVLVAAGCGKKEKTLTPAEWANGVCTAITTWANELKTAQAGLTSGGIPTKAEIQDAGKKVEDATNTLAGDLKSLGKPNTSSGQKAKDTLDQLSSQLQDARASLKDTVSSVNSIGEVATAVSKAAATIATAQSQITKAYSSIQSADTSGELRQAFTSSPACKSLQR